MSIKKLNLADKPALEIFLKEHADTSMFLRSNLHNSGLSYQEKPYHGEYLASFDDSGTVNGVLAHYWNGNLMMQSPNLVILKNLVEAFKNNVNREIAGILGDERQAKVVIEQLGLSAADYSVNYPDDLYALELDQLIFPTHINKLDYEMIAAKDCKVDLIVEWLSAYHVEALGAELGSQSLMERIEHEVQFTFEKNERFVLKIQGKPVSLCGFNAKLPDVVQVGPVWTPVEYRNQGYARTLLALSLIDVQKSGVKRAILFTNNQAAIRSYESLGFKKVGAYRLAILKKPITLNMFN